MKKENIIVNKCINFALRIINLQKSLTHEKKEYIISHQITKSGTSIGANIFESQRAFSKNDFYYKISISLKEASESKYWLLLLYKSDYISEDLYKSLLNDLQEIIKILMSISKSQENRELNN